MKDRIPTEIVEIAGKPGEYAIRYGEYDAEGNLIGYRYFAPADEPIEKGTAINKASLLKDTTAALYGLGADAVPDDAFVKLAPAAYLPRKNLLNILRLKLQQSLKANDIDAWSDLLDDDSGINASASKGWRVSGGKVTYNPTTISNTVDGSQVAFGYGNSNGNVKAGQSFTLSTNITQSTMSIKVKLRKFNSPQDAVVMSIYSVSDNIPNTLLYTSDNQINASEISDTFTEFTFNFSGISMTAGVKYAFVLSRTVIPVPDDWTIYYVSDDGDTYSNGGVVFCAADGVWDYRDYDLYFIITTPMEASVVWNAVTSTEPLSRVAIAADQDEKAGTITWYLSDDGTNWTQITALDTMQAVNFDTTSVYLKCELTGDAEVRAVAWGGY